MFKNADIFRQKIMLLDATTFAVMSVQNSVEMLRRGFRAYARSDNWSECREAFKYLNYGNDKFKYTEHNFEQIFSSCGNQICSELENNNVWRAVELCVDHLKGVSWIKAAFVPAMLGFTDVLCIDTNVAQMVPDDSVQAEEYKSAQSYKNAVDRVLDEFPELSDMLSPFMVQWVVFDTNRENGVEHHQEWFNHLLPGTIFSQQAALGEY